MILDILAQASRYEILSPRFARAFAFLRGIRGTEAPGRVDLDGENLFAILQKYTTKPLDGAQLEAHRRYIDVQYVHSGRETILWAPLTAMRTVNMPYDEKQDAALFQTVPEQTPLRLSAGWFAILFPEDAHGPALQWDQPSEVFKVVVKVRV